MADGMIHSGDPSSRQSCISRSPIRAITSQPTQATVASSSKASLALRVGVLSRILPLSATWMCEGRSIRPIDAALPGVRMEFVVRR